jgi:hypothetical protein
MTARRLSTSAARCGLVVASSVVPTTDKYALMATRWWCLPRHFPAWSAVYSFAFCRDKGMDHRIQEEPQLAMG